MYPSSSEPEKSLTERAVVFVTNNLTTATIIPVILAGCEIKSIYSLKDNVSVISIILFAILFAPSSWLQTLYNEVLQFMNSNAASKEAEDGDNQNDDEDKNNG